MNLVDMVKGQLTDAVLQKLGGAVGLGGNDVSRAMGAIIPTQMSALMQQGSTQSGAQSLLDMAGKFAHLGNFGDALGQPNGVQTLLGLGSSLLPSLLGGRQDNLLGGLSSLLGIGKSPLGSLMSLAGPLIMGQLGSHAKATGLNPAGLMSLLGGMKGDVDKITPPGLGGVLSSVLGGLGGVTGAAGAAASAATNLATGAAGNIAGQVGNIAGAASNLGGTAAKAASAAVATEATRAAGGFPWAWLAVPLVALAGYFLWPKGGSTATTTPTTTETTTTATDTTAATPAAATCSKDFSMSVKDGDTVNEGFRYGGEGSKGYSVTITRADGRLIGKKPLPLGADCTWGYDSKPGKGKIIYELTDDSGAAVNKLTLNVK